MSDRTEIHIVSKFTCSFSHRQTESKPLLIVSQPGHRVWFEYSESTDARERKSVLCVYRVVSIKSGFVDELRAIARGGFEQNGVPFTVDLEKKTKQRFEFPSGLSPGAEDRFGQIKTDIKDFAERLVSTLRWRFDLAGPGKAFPTAANVLWSENAKTWVTLPSKMFASPEVRRDIIVDCLTEDILSELRAEHLAEPIAHSLFRDAWFKRHSDHKAALAQGVSALEVGVKNCIVSLLPDAEYLVLEMPSPPVVNLLRDFLPTLIGKTSTNAPNLSANLIKLVSNMVYQRNLVVHKGELTVDGGKVSEYLELIHDLLYFLDFVSGNQWALALTSREFKNWIRQELPNANLGDPLTAHESKGEPSDAREISAQSVLNSTFTPRSP